MKYHQICILLIVLTGSIFLYYSNTEWLKNGPLETHINISNAATEDVVYQNRIISITNAITKPMLAYRYLGTRHIPAKFILNVNGVNIPTGKSIPVNTVNNKLTITYRYSFAKGLYRGKRTELFKLNPSATDISITFSWKNKPRLKINAH